MQELQHRPNARARRSDQPRPRTGLPRHLLRLQPTVARSHQQIRHSDARRPEERIRRTRRDKHDGNSKRKQGYVRSGRHDGQPHSIYDGAGNRQPDRLELRYCGAICRKRTLHACGSPKKKGLTFPQVPDVTGGPSGIRTRDQ